MELPLMRRGLSPEGRRIRERHQGSLTIGIQGVTVHPAERGGRCTARLAGRSQGDFVQQNVRRLHEIQSRCRERDGVRRTQPMKATRHSSGSSASSVQADAPPRPSRPVSSRVKRGQSLEREGSAHSDYFSLTEDSKTALGSRSGSPARTPLPRDSPTPGAGGPSCDLDPRRARTEGILTRIRTRRPSCELDRRSFYRSIEDQHRTLPARPAGPGWSAGREGVVGSPSDTQRSEGKSSLGRNEAHVNKAINPDGPRNNGHNKLVHLPAQNMRKNDPLTQNIRKNDPFTQNMRENEANIYKSINSEDQNYINKNYKNPEARRSHGLMKPEAKSEAKSALRASSRMRRRFSRSHNDVSSLSRGDPGMERGDLLTWAARGVPPLGGEGQLDLQEGPGKRWSDEGSLKNSNTDDQSVVNGQSVIRNDNEDVVNDNGVMSDVMGPGCEDFGIKIQTDNQNEGEEVFQDLSCISPRDRALMASTPVEGGPKKGLQRGKAGTASTLKSRLLKSAQHRPVELPSTYKKGQVPKYILERKEEERRRAELALAVDPDCPPGHAPLSDQERLNTLHLLQKSQAEVTKDLSSLPVAQDTLRVRKLRVSLEEKLTQIEDGLRIFSQPRVYVINDD